jgi:predicted AAA+ superfamily ATPase
MKINKKIKVKPSNVFSFSFNQRDLEKRWLRGNLPGSYNATNDQLSSAFRQNYIEEFLQNLTTPFFSVSPDIMRQFMLDYTAHHGEVLNATQVGKEVGMSTYAVNNCLSILAKTSMVRVLQPWYQELTKRQVKTPKIYFKDTGILHTLLNIVTPEQLRASPRLANSWKGFVLEEIISHYNIPEKDCYFWSTHAGTWIDLFIILDGKRIAFEFKCLDRPKLKPSMKISVEDLNLDHLYVIYPGEETLSLSDKVTAMGLEQFKNFS